MRAATRKLLANYRAPIAAQPKAFVYPDYQIDGKRCHSVAQKLRYDPRVKFGKVDRASILALAHSALQATWAPAQSLTEWEDRAVQWISAHEK